MSVFTDSELKMLCSTDRFSQGVMDRLSKLRYNPFEPNQNIALSGNNTELDTIST